MERPCPCDLLAQRTLCGILAADVSRRSLLTDAFDSWRESVLRRARPHIPGLLYKRLARAHVWALPLQSKILDKGGHPGYILSMSRALTDASVFGAPVNPVRAITFDVGGTLIEPWPSVGSIYAQVAARHGWKDLSVEALEQQFAAAWGGLKEFNHTRREWAEIVDASFRGLVSPPPSQTFFPELFSCFSEPQAWRVFEDVEPALDALASRGFKLGVISNWDERLQPLLGRLNLLGYFDVVVVSCDVGFPKPSRVIFEHAAEKFGLPPSAILHVGDSAEMDLRGAKTAGLQAVGLRRRPESHQQGQPARHITSLHELEALLAS